jgi:hypothetical protein
MYQGLKQCSSCKKILELSVFYKKTKSKDGYSNICKACTNSRHAEYRKTEKGREAIKRSNHAWAAKNKEHIRQKAVEYRQQNHSTLDQRARDFIISKNTEGPYVTWLSMKQRCTNPNHHAYDRYGGRGIQITCEWDNYDAFHAWSKDTGWQKGLTIHRIDNDLGYAPENCTWITRSENTKEAWRWKNRA